MKNTNPVMIAFGALIIVAATLALGVGSPAQESGARSESAQNPPAPESKSPETESQPVEVSDAVTKLPVRLRMLLTREMMAVESAMQGMFANLTRGRWDSAAALARRVHRSFVLKQEMTDEERETLKSTVPADFIQMDKQFHEDALELAEAAENRNASKVKRQFAQMTTACVECHRRFATHKFPGFLEAAVEDEKGDQGATGEGGR